MGCIMVERGTLSLLRAVSIRGEVFSEAATGSQKKRMRGEEGKGRGKGRGKRKGKRREGRKVMKTGEERKSSREWDGGKGKEAMDTDLAWWATIWPVVLCRVRICFTTLGKPFTDLPTTN